MSRSLHPQCPLLLCRDHKLAARCAHLATTPCIPLLWLLCLHYLTLWPLPHPHNPVLSTLPLCIFLCTHRDPKLAARCAHLALQQLLSSAAPDGDQVAVTLRLLLTLTSRDEDKLALLT
jgi:hypothetical protein